MQKLHYDHKAHLCVSYDSHTVIIIALISINQLVLEMEALCVFCEGGAEFLIIT
jgi:hypothetical protein